MSKDEEDEDIKDEEIVYCSDGEECENENYALKSEIEPSEWDSWVCKDCMDNIIGIELIDFIKERIKVTESEEDDRSKFIFRELVQNADDAKSQKLVLRFEEDALYVANDGRAFTATSWDGNKSDWDRISEVLKMHQADDKETTGHFGSGFQTVYALTNQPEIHSNGNSRAMNPIDKEWINDIPERTSPYVRKEENKGVLFRFPWRDDESAEEDFDESFSDKSTWPRWGKEERMNLFKDLKDYLHDSILCCQHLTKIRLIWAEDEEIEAFQVERDFKLNGHHDSNNTFTGKVGFGKGSLVENQDFKKSFLEENWGYVAREEVLYHISYKKVKKDGEIQYMWKKGGGEGYVITSSDAEGYSPEKEVKKNDCYLLLPYEPIATDDGITGRYLYSVIPLPRKGKNGFMFTAHLFPVESRKDVKIDGKFGDWYELVMENIAELYLDSFGSFIDRAKERLDDKDTVQKIILNNIPRTELSEWMRPGRTGGWDHGFDQKIKRKVVESDVLLSEDTWISPNNGYRGNKLEREVISELEGYPISEIFWKYLPILIKEELDDNEFSPEVFKKLWKRFFEKNKKEDGHLIYGQELEGDGELNINFLEPLIKYALLESDSRDLIDLKLVPGKDGVLRSIKDFPIIPNQFRVLKKLFSEKHQIHDDFRNQVENVAEEERTADPFWITSILDEAVRDQGERFDGVNDDDLENISRLLLNLSRDDDFFVKEKMKDYKILPYEKEGKIRIGTPNTFEKDDEEKIVNSENTGGHIGENLSRDSIFATKKCEVKGLTDEIEDKIKIFKVNGLNEEEKRNIENKFSLESLASNKTTPVNFVRHFLSPNNGSIFEDENLEEFLGIEDEEELIEQKKEMQEALKVYFKGDAKTETRTKITPKYMSRVPSLYDEEGIWREADEFAIDMTPGLRLFDLRKLHPEIENEWEEDVLTNIGVTRSPEYEVIEGKIEELRESLEDNRGELASIFIYLLTSDGISEDVLDDLNDYFSDKRVIPTKSGYGRLGEVYSPSKDLAKCLGSDYEKIFDLSSCDEEVKSFIHEKMGDEKIEEERLERSGFLLEPQKKDLLDVLETSIKEDIIPPENLFKELEEKAVDDDLSDDHRYYHHDGEWMKYERMVIDGEDEDIPRELEDALFVIKESKNHPMDYLRMIGVSERLNPNILLKKLADRTIPPSKEYWSDLYKRKSELDISEEYKDVNLYPFTPNEFVDPSDVLIGSKDKDEEGLPLFPEKGRYFSKYYILDEELEDKEKELLKELGAEIEEELSIRTLLDLIKSYHDEELYEKKIDSILRCLRRIYAINPQESLVEDKVWPIRKCDTFELGKPPNAYLPDSTELYKKFEDDLAFAFVRVDEEVDDDLVDFAEFNRAKSLVDEVDISFEEPDLAEYEEDAVKYFEEISDCVEKKFPKVKENDGLEWIDNLSVKPVSGELKKEYKVEDEKVIESSEEGLISVIDEGKMIWYISYPLSDNDLNLISEKFKEIIIDHMDYRPKYGGELKHLIYRLMHRAGEGWEAIHPDFKYTGPKPGSPGGPLYLNQDIEGSSVGYLSTLNELESSYGVCQICGAITPRSEDGHETSEKVKKIISKRGGNLKPPEDMKDKYNGYDIGNSLFLCPRHHALYMRGLVKFKPWDIDQIDEEDIDFINDRLTRLDDEDKDELPLPIYVYENPEDGVTELEWRERNLTFQKDHYQEFLKNMRTYFELKISGDGR